MSGDLIAFLSARLDEDEETAKRAAACGKLVREGVKRGLAPGDWSWLADYGQPQPGDIALIDHQVRFDPARVLREVEAKRAILADWQYCSQEQYAIREASFYRSVLHLAAVYDGHPDYQQEWKP